MIPFGTTKPFTRELEFLNTLGVLKQLGFFWGDFYHEYEFPTIERDNKTELAVPSKRDVKCDW